MFLRASRLLVEACCIVLWQSAHATLLFWCADPSQCIRLPPSWQVSHCAFCESTGVPHFLVKPISSFLSVAFFACSEPGPWQASQLRDCSSLAGCSLKTLA